MQMAHPTNIQVGYVDRVPVRRQACRESPLRAWQDRVRGVGRRSLRRRPVRRSLRGRRSSERQRYQSASPRLQMNHASLSPQLSPQGRDPCRRSRRSWSTAVPSQQPGLPGDTHPWCGWRHLGSRSRGIAWRPLAFGSPIRSPAPPRTPRPSSRRSRRSESPCSSARRLSGQASRDTGRVPARRDLASRRASLTTATAAPLSTSKHQVVQSIELVAIDEPGRQIGWLTQPAVGRDPSEGRERGVPRRGRPAVVPSRSNSAVVEARSEDDQGGVEGLSGAWVGCDRVRDVQFVACA
jgi:hypothetical protein